MEMIVLMILGNLLTHYSVCSFLKDSHILMKNLCFFKKKKDKSIEGG